MGVAEFALLVITGAMSGVASGLFGIGGGVVIVPMLVYFLHYNQQQAVATSLTVLLPPLGLFAVWEYNRHGYINWRSAFVICVSMLLTAYFGAKIGTSLGSNALKLAFGVFLIVLGIYTVYSSYSKL